MWRTTGGKHRYLLGEATRLVDDLIPAFRAAAADLIERYQAHPLAPACLDALLDEQARLTTRSKRFASARDGREIWQAAAFADASRVPELTVEEFNLQLGKSA